MASGTILFDGDTDLGHYLVMDTTYTGRPARVLYSDHGLTAQSGVAHDDDADLLFDYNQRFLEIVRCLSPKRILLLGGGAFTFPKALLEEFPHVLIDVIEPNAHLLDIARRFFDFRPSKNVRVFTTDGRHYLRGSTMVYDLILIDAFIHTTIPRSLRTVEAAREFKRHLHRSGTVAINLIARYMGTETGFLHNQVAALSDVFCRLQLFPASDALPLWSPQNFVLISSDGVADLSSHLRYAPLSIPRPATSDRLCDEVH